ncbi:MAG: AtpZ/AtpI family protein [Ignavibacteria bacterium]|nr:AtpZ/AtpI family protein [Ignavibacteria bacterium]
MSKEIPERKSGSVQRDLAPYVGLGSQLAAAVIGCGLLGWWLDGKYGTTPWFTIGLGCFGAVAGMTHFIRAAMQANAHDPTNNKQ